MKIGLIGLPSSGKSSCFAALTGLPAQASGAGERIGTVEVPEPRLLRLQEIHNARRIVYPEMFLVDTAAIESDATPEQIDRHLANLAREADAFAIVLQCFGDLDHRGNPLDAAGDLETLLLELSLADLTTVEKRLERLTSGRMPKNPNEEALLLRLKEGLSQGDLVYRMGISADEEKLLSGQTLITSLPLMVACNIGEDDLEGTKAAAATALAEERGLPHLNFCAALEVEIAQLPEEEQKEFLQDYGLESSARSRFIRAAYDLLDLVTMLTAGEQETKAWPIRRNSTAPQAAGKIHTDLQTGFIRAETVAFDDIDRCGTMAECRKLGLVRLEGKEYIVKDGDVMDIRFSR
jgi:GTP-binding protein YchF